MLSTGGPKKGTNLKELSKRNPILVEKDLISIIYKSCLYFRQSGLNSEKARLVRGPIGTYPQSYSLIPGSFGGSGFSKNLPFATLGCKRNIEMTPLCKIEVTHPRVLGSREVRRGGVVDEQAGVRPS
jgi:hypothetical protein